MNLVLVGVGLNIGNVVYRKRKINVLDKRYNFLTYENCEEHAEQNGYIWKHQRGRCPYCVLLSKEVNAANLVACSLEEHSQTERDLTAFTDNLPLNNN